MPFDPDVLPPAQPVERMLGFFDAPQLIQCRRCRELKRASHLHFRNIRQKTDRFRTTCRKCEKKSDYAQSVTGRLSALRNRPLLTDKERAVLMAGDGTVLRPSVAEQVNADRKAKLRATRLKAVDAAFREQWTEVRKLVAWRRAQLALRLERSKWLFEKEGAQAGLYYVMHHSPTAARYVRTLLAIYSAIVARLRNLKTWRQTIGMRRPPAHWLHAVESSNHKAWMRVSPLELATNEERALLKRLDPDKHEGEIDWRLMVSETGRVNATLVYHVYPLLTPDGPIKLSETSPAWLKAFNGA